MQDAKAFPADNWPSPVIDFLSGRSTNDRLMSASASAEPGIQKARRCGASFYLGEWHLIQKNSKQAKLLFREDQKLCPKTFAEYDGAVAELRRLPQ